MTTRRLFLSSAFVGLVAGKGHKSAFAQAKSSRKRMVIGRLTEGAVDPASDAWFREAMNAFGHDDFAIETRQAKGLGWRLAPLAAELVNLPVDVIWTAGTYATQVALRATRKIPIVMVSSDPVGAGIVTNLERPGGNVTGLNLASAAVVHKRLQLIKELVPGALNVVALGPSGPDAIVEPIVKSWWGEVRKAAAALHMSAHYASIDVYLYPWDDQYAGFASRPATVITAIESPYILQNAEHFAALDLKHRLPAVYPFPQHVQAGGLCSYGVSLKFVALQVAHYVSRILHGAKAGDLPIEFPNTYELSINMRTARALGLSVSPRLQRSADLVS